MEKQFNIHVDLGRGNAEDLEVVHKDESFEIKSGDNQGVILDNGDGAWQLVSGSLSQEKVNLIGDAIEKHLNSQIR